MNQLQDVLRYALFPVAAIILGGLLAAWRPPGRALQSTIQHFAAGVVFAAVAAEILPEATAQPEPIALGVGFVAGVAAMLALGKITELGSATEADAPGGATRLVVTVGVNLLIDGLLIGVAVVAGSAAGILITLALTIEVFFLGLAVAVSIIGNGGSRGNVIATSAGLALLLGIGAAIGGMLLGDLAGASFVAVLAFAMAALLYLVTEELLVEAHEVDDTAAATTMFFVGFLLVLLLETAI